MPALQIKRVEGVLPGAEIGNTLVREVIDTVSGRVSFISTINRVIIFVHYYKLYFLTKVFLAEMLPKGRNLNSKLPRISNYLRILYSCRL